MIDLDSVPPITRGWWVGGPRGAGAPDLLACCGCACAGASTSPRTGAVLWSATTSRSWTRRRSAFAALPRKSYYMAKQELFRIPGLDSLI